MTTCHADMTMEAIQAVHPAARRALFRAYHIGGCSSCGYRPEETLAQVCARNDGIDPAAAIQTILQAQADEDKLQVNASDLHARLARGESIQLVDIRSREEYEAVSIPGSLLLTQELSQELLHGPDGSGTVVLIDHAGLHVMDAVAYFIGHGRKNTLGLRGGIDAWAVEIDPAMPRYLLE
jgi:rhodanese-related sulfurtransferase